MLGKEWYSGNTGIIPVDDSIREEFDTGYLHHIKRLMVIGNYMNLCNIKPSEGFRWFMEFSCDSYEWVMYQNVYDMVFFSTGGKTMRRPYISSSNYILNMRFKFTMTTKEKRSNVHIVMVVVKTDVIHVMVQVKLIVEVVMGQVKKNVLIVMVQVLKLVVNVMAMEKLKIMTMKVKM